MHICVFVTTALRECEIPVADVAGHLRSNSAAINRRGAWKVANWNLTLSLLFDNPTEFIDFAFP